MEQHYSLKSLGYHYYQMLIKNVKKLETMEQVGIMEVKVCIQAIRCFCMLRNLLKHRKLVKSLQLSTLLDRIPIEGRVAEDFRLAIASKKHCTGIEEVPIHSIHDFLNKQLPGIENELAQLPIGENAESLLNREIWRILQV